MLKIKILLSCFMFLIKSNVSGQYQLTDILRLDSLAYNRSMFLSNNIDSFTIIKEINKYITKKEFKIKDIRAIKVIPYFGYDTACVISLNCEGQHPRFLSCFKDSPYDLDYYLVNIKNKKYYMYCAECGSNKIYETIDPISLLKIKDTINRKGNLASLQGTTVIIKNGNIYFDDDEKKLKLYKETKRSIQVFFHLAFGIFPCGRF